ncbi:MAG: hypothetical protein RI575_17810 [Balneolaceae bacterium]|nr:hypothetical protein [Balneolaceae bacterium]
MKSTDDNIYSTGKDGNVDLFVIKYRINNDQFASLTFVKTETKANESILPACNHTVFMTLK